VVRQPLACGDTFVLRPLESAEVTIRITDDFGCAEWSSVPDLHAIGDLPVTIAPLPLKGHDEKSCAPPHGVGNCVDTACRTSCTTDGFKLAGKADTGFRDCNVRFEDGCEVDVMHDSNNCGACDKKCGTA